MHAESALLRGTERFAVVGTFAKKRSVELGSDDTMGTEDSGGAEGPSQARLNQLVSTTQDAVVFIDGAGNIVLANAAAYRIFGYDEGELAGRDVRVLMAEPYASQHHGYVERYERTGEKRAMGRIREVSAKRKNGEEFPIELSVTKITEEADGARYGAFIRDVSEKVRLQREIMDRERLTTVGTTASMLVHEIGNPLNNMALQLEVLRRKVTRGDAGEETVEKVDSCLGEVARLSRLVQEFRALSSRKSLIRRPVVLTDWVERVPTNLAHMGPHIRIERSFLDGRALVLVDVDKMQQVLLNLCHNAIEAMPQGGTLTLRTTSDAAHYCLEVVDTGSGVPEGLAVFEPFVTSKPDGTGLGLAICAEIVREHGGTLTYESEATRGTTFRLRLPLASARS